MYRIYIRAVIMKAVLNERLTIKNWYVLLGPPNDDPFQTIVEYYVSNDTSIPNERIIKEKTFQTS